MGDSVARTPFRSNGKKAPQLSLSQLEEQARNPWGLPKRKAKVDSEKGAKAFPRAFG